MIVQFSKIKITSQQLMELREAGLIDEIALRNIYIKREFVRRCKISKKKTKKSIIEKIAAELNMVPDTVSIIIYRKSNRKKTPFYEIEDLK